MGNWTHCPNCGELGNPNNAPFNYTISWSNTPNDAISLTFVGDGIRYVFTKAYNRGIVKVTIDGEITHEIDLYAPTQPQSVNHEWQESVHYPLSYGTHQIHLAVTGKKNPSAAGVYIDLDRFVVD
jgi:hypothetical protein